MLPMWLFFHLLFLFVSLSEKHTSWYFKYIDLRQPVSELYMDHNVLRNGDVQPEQSSFLYTH